MAEWRAEFSEKAESDLRTLDRLVRRQILDRIGWLVENFDSITPLPLHGEWRGFFKLRVGDWRVVYESRYHGRKPVVTIQTLRGTKRHFLHGPTSVVSVVTG